LAKALYNNTLRRAVFLPSRHESLGVTLWVNNGSPFKVVLGVLSQ